MEKRERSSTSLEGQRGVKESPELIVYHFTSLDPVSLCLSVSNSIKLSINATYLIPSYPPMHSETARVPIMKILFGTVEGMMGGSDFNDALGRFRDALRNS